jgi:REP element-mobilizing transposase RayT
MSEQLGNFYRLVPKTLSERFFFFSRSTPLMGYHPRIETREYPNLITSRTRDSRLWFVNNNQLEERILGLTAKYATRHEITLYGFALEGNHFHMVAQINKENRGAFLRDLKSTIAKSVPKLTPSYTGGGVWGRRFSNEFIADEATLEEYFFYVVLQPIKDGLVDKISECPGYNCFHDAVWGKTRTFWVFNGTAYYKAMRFGAKVEKKDFFEEFTLTYARLPGYEHLTQKEYATLMHQKLEERRQEILRYRRAHGKKSFVGRFRLKQVLPGSFPKTTKTSTAFSHRPRVLSLCKEKWAEMRDWYFGILFHFKYVSERYRRGELMAEFPIGTYRPYVAV